MAEERARAVSEVIGAIAYALLRVFQVAAAATTFAPTLALRERQAAFAVEEHERFRVIRRRLAAICDDPHAAMERFRRPLDAFYAAAPTGSWLEAQVFHFVGDSITADFADMLVPHLGEKTAAAVREALADRGAHAAFALDQIQGALATGGPEVTERVGAVVGRVIGDAMTSFREAVLESDALALVVGGPDAVKELVLEILARHRERLEHIGLELVE